MRYRRLSYRYTVVMATSRSRPLADVWPRQAASVGLAQPWRPPTNIVETTSEIVVTVELAGVDHEQLDVLLFEDALIVDGERRLPPAQGPASSTLPRSGRASSTSKFACQPRSTRTRSTPATNAACSKCAS